jgi:hypothetical protein
MCVNLQLPYQPLEKRLLYFKVEVQSRLPLIGNYALDNATLVGFGQEPA